MKGRGLTSSRLGSRHVTPSRPSIASSESKRNVSTRSADSIAQIFTSHLPTLMDIQVAGACSMMKCGDVIYRSTLDLVARGEDQGVTPEGIALLSVLAAFFFLPPGPAPALYDLYLGSKIYRKNAKVYSKDDVILGKKLATGGFGTVFLASLMEADGSATPVVVKKAKDFGEAEVWMNERMDRMTGGVHIAQFITAFAENPSAVGKSGPLADNAVWLVWKYEGNYTLYDLMAKKEFPYNVEPLLFKRELTSIPKGPRRKLVTITLLMKQLLEALEACHKTGIVHRDVKPQNAIISADDNKIKLIDLGAAADLRVGINYAPKEYLLDPRYAPPQQYVMSTQTARPPPPPVAAILSPVLWAMESPDRFDSYSAGVCLLQMAFPALRTDKGLEPFNKKLEQKYDFDLRAWRRAEDRRGASKDLLEGFEILDLDDGAAWNLLCDLMSYEPRKRPSATEALSSPMFDGDADSEELAVSSLFSSASKGLNGAVSSALNGPIGKMLDEAVADGTTKGALTEGQILEELGLEEEADRPTRYASSTIAWFKQRQAEVNRRQFDAQLAKAPSKTKTVQISVPSPAAADPIKPSHQANPFQAFFNRKQKVEEVIEEETEEQEEEEEEKPAEQLQLRIANFFNFGRR